MNLDGTFQNLIDKLQGWVEALILLLPDLVVAMLVVFVAWFVAKGVRKVVRGGMNRVSSYHQLNGLVSTIAYIVALGAGVLIALEIVDLSKAVTSLLAGVGILGLALGFAFQDIAGNFMSGILLAIRRPFVEGDIIETNGHFGMIQEINLRSTHLRTFQGQIVIIPNSEVFQNAITNYSKTGQRRVDLNCGVAYGDDLEHVRTVALAAVNELDAVDQNKPVDFYFNEFGDSSINFVLRFWVDFARQTDFLSAQSEAIIRLKKAFDANGITIPFPIRTLDFGVVGGVNLNEVLPPRFYDSGNGQSAA